MYFNMNLFIQGYVQVVLYMIEMVGVSTLALTLSITIERYFGYNWIHAVVTFFVFLHKIFSKSFQLSMFFWCLPQHPTRVGRYDGDLGRLLAQHLFLPN